MEPVEWIFLDVAFLASKAGVSAREIEKYQDATDGCDGA